MLPAHCLGWLAARRATQTNRGPLPIGESLVGAGPQQRIVRALRVTTPWRVVINHIFSRRGTFRPTVRDRSPPGRLLSHGSGVRSASPCPCQYPRPQISQPRTTVPHRRALDSLITTPFSTCGARAIGGSRCEPPGQLRLAPLCRLGARLWKTTRGMCPGRSRVEGVEVADTLTRSTALACCEGVAPIRTHVSSRRRMHSERRG